MFDTNAQSETLLEVNNIEVIYNHVILVLKGVSLSVPKGGITALLGGNGAGKSTTLKSISGLLKSERGDVTKGSVVYRGENLAGKNPADLVKTGIIQVMEGRHCFEHLTVEENLLTGSYTRGDGRGAVAADLEMVYEYFPRLKTRRKSQAVDPANVDGCGGQPHPVAPAGSAAVAGGGQIIDRLDQPLGLMGQQHHTAFRQRGDVAAAPAAGQSPFGAGIIADVATVQIAEPIYLSGPQQPQINVALRQ